MFVGEVECLLLGVDLLLAVEVVGDGVLAVGEGEAELDGAGTHHVVVVFQQFLHPLYDQQAEPVVVSAHPGGQQLDYFQIPLLNALQNGEVGGAVVLLLDLLGDELVQLQQALEPLLPPLALQLLRYPLVVGGQVAELVVLEELLAALRLQHLAEDLHESAVVQARLQQTHHFGPQLVEAEQLNGALVEEGTQKPPHVAVGSFVFGGVQSAVDVGQIGKFLHGLLLFLRLHFGRLLLLVLEPLQFLVLGQDLAVSIAHGLQVNKSMKSS